MGPPTLKPTERLAESLISVIARPMIAANPKVVRRRLSNLVNDKAIMGIERRVISASGK
jgi:hypothetical protein